MKPYDLERLMKNVYPEPNTGCWLWAGCVDKDGYGRVSPKKTGIRRTHRLSYLFHKGDFNRTLQVCHTCDQPSCVNPEHLFLGTNADNMKDRNRKGRTASGSKHYRTKLTPFEKSEIKKLYLARFPSTEIASVFSITIPYVSKLAKKC